MFRKLELGLTAMIVVAAATAFGTGAQALEKVKMTIAASSNNYAPYFAAIEKGYFKEEGFDVEIIKAGGGTATPALMSGSVDFSTSGASALSAILKGAPLRLVFFPWDRPTYQLWSTKPEFTKLSQVQGKAVGIQTRGDTFEISLRIILKNNGIDPNSISYTPLGYGGGRRAAIASGSLPFAVLSKIDVERLRGTGGLKNGNMVFDMYNAVRMPYTGIAVSSRALAKDRERVKRFVRACVKGLAYMAAHKQGTVDIVRKYNKRTKPKALAIEYDSVRASKTADGTVSEALQRQDVQVRSALIGVKKGRVPPLSKIFDFSMAKEVNRSLAAAGWKPIE
jgi:NitT/TauT family transport system substrate-binding protein